MWFEKVSGKTRVERTIYLHQNELTQLQEEAEILSNKISGKKRLTLSDIIRIKLFYANYFADIMAKKKLQDLKINLEEENEEQSD